MYIVSNAGKEEVQKFIASSFVNARATIIGLALGEKVAIVLSHRCLLSFLVQHCYEVKATLQVYGNWTLDHVVAAVKCILNTHGIASDQEDTLTPINAISIKAFAMN